MRWLWVVCAWLLFFVEPAQAQAQGLQGVTLVTEVADGDLVINVEPDGGFSIDGKPIATKDLQARIGKELAATPGRRVVIVPHTDAPYEGILRAVHRARVAGAPVIALTAILRPVDEALAGDIAGGQVQQLGDGLSGDLQKSLQPKRHRFPQNPYAQNDFTAYTLEFGELEVGLATFAYGVAPRVQLSSNPMLDLIGAFNGAAKVNAVRMGPFDAAVVGQVYVVPINGLLESLSESADLGLSGTGEGGTELFTDELRYLSLGAQTSLQVVGGWSLHAGASYARAVGEGVWDFKAMPPVVIPGVDPGGTEITLVTKAVGELMQVRFATDYRFNRRDSVILQFGAPIYGQARGILEGDSFGPIPIPQELALAVTYGDSIPIQTAYRGSLAYQFSWKTVDLRAGVGMSPIFASWVFQAFDLTVHLGGKTRREETRINRGFNRNLDESGGDAR